MTDREFSPEFFPQLEAMRGIAALIVVFYHFPFVDGEKFPLIAAGDLFVDFFFVLSGFVMTHAYAKRVSEGMPFGQFVGLRLARLYPLHFAMLIAWLGYIAAKVLAAKIAGIDGELGGSVGPWSFLLNLTLLQAVGLTDRLTWNAPSWSISVEFFAYLLFYAVVHFFRRPYLGISAAIILCNYALIIALSTDSSSKSLLVTYDYGLLRCAAGFFAGVVIYQVRNSIPVPKSIWSASCVEAALLVACGACVSRGQHDIGWQLASIVMFVAIIHFFASARGVFRILLETRPFRYLGRISYSIYLTHALVLTIALNVAEYVLKWPTDTFPGTSIPRVETELAMPINFALVLVVIGISHLTWRWIEIPGQKLGKRIIMRR